MFDYGSWERRCQAALRLWISIVHAWVVHPGSLCRRYSEYACDALYLSLETSWRKMWKFLSWRRVCHLSLDLIVLSQYLRLDCTLSSVLKWFQIRIDVRFEWLWTEGSLICDLFDFLHTLISPCKKMCMIFARILWIWIKILHWSTFVAQKLFFFCFTCTHTSFVYLWLN